ncbi:ABC transporter ATP-binding protein [Neopoerus faecalis]|uniref:ABC transporter ATP-binding protein n=1 Tax=Neopoerus faecalis TaxID=3032125 RepID=UPI002570996A|nr:oligopeptide/dipeptide ABC transporter ATP-binding protein [Neopoerus faecalis]
MAEILRVEDLKKYFATKKGTLHAVDGVTFTVDAGKTLGIVGESGCGKSTLGRVILHLHERTEGRIVFQGEDISDVSNAKLKELRKDMQIIFQDPYASLNPRMSIGDIIAEPLKIYKLCNSKAEREKKVHEIMDVVGLAERTYSLYPHELDGGRRQRVGIARALILDPKLVVCDEPVSALDVSIQAQILNLMMELQKERNLTYLFITHNLSVVKHISDDITVMYLGQMVEKAGSSEIFAHQYHPYTKALISAIPLPKYNAPDNQIILKGEITSPINVTKSCRFAPRCIYAKPECFNQEPALEEVEPGHFVKCHFVREINGL